MLAISFLAPTGIEIGSLNWQSVFAGSIFLAIGANALVFGLITKTYGVDRGFLKEDRLVRFYRKIFSLERVLALAGILMVVGLALNFAIAGHWGAEPLGAFVLVQQRPQRDAAVDHVFAVITGVVFWNPCRFITPRSQPPPNKHWRAPSTPCREPAIKPTAPLRSAIVR